MRTHSIQKVAVADFTNALEVLTLSGSAGFPRNGMLPIESWTASVERLIVIVPRMSWPAIASRNTELGSSTAAWKNAGSRTNGGTYGPLLCEPTPSLLSSTSGTMCSRFGGGGVDGISTGWIPRPKGAKPVGGGTGVNAGRLAMG